MLHRGRNAVTDPIVPEQRALMNKIAHTLDVAFNGPPPAPPRAFDRKVGFVVLSFNFGEVSGGRVNYISNADRDDMVAALKELLGRWEGRVADTPSTAQ